MGRAASCASWNAAGRQEPQRPSEVVGRRQRDRRPLDEHDRRPGKGAHVVDDHRSALVVERQRDQLVVGQLPPGSSGRGPPTARPPGSRPRARGSRCAHVRVSVRWRRRPWRRARRVATEVLPAAGGPPSQRTWFRWRPRGRRGGRPGRGAPARRPAAGGRRGWPRGRGRAGAGGLQVVHLDVEVQLHLRVTGPGRPDRRDVLLLELDRQAHAAVGRTDGHPVGLVAPDGPAEQLAVEAPECSGVAGVEDRGGHREAWGFHDFLLDRPIGTEPMVEYRCHRQPSETGGQR